MNTTPCWRWKLLCVAEILVIVELGHGSPLAQARAHGNLCGLARAQVPVTAARARLDRFPWPSCR